MAVHLRKRDISCAMIVFSLIASSSGQLFEDEQCSLGNGKFGTCKLLQNCSVVAQMISNKKQQPVICSFKQHTPVICCPENNAPAEALAEVPTRTSTMPSMSAGSPCTLESGAPGTCQNLEDCPEANTITPGSIQQTCHYQESAPIVCCPLSQRTTTETAVKIIGSNAGGNRRTTIQSTAKTTITPPRASLRTGDAMCEHYAQFVFEMVQSPVLFIIPHVTNDSQCSSEVHINQLPSKHVALAQFKEFPHITRLGYGNESDIQWNCVGSLISENYILTASGCITSPTSGNVQWARIGDLEPAVYSVNTKELQRVVEWKTPPGSRSRNTLALLRLERNVDFWGYRRPACLNSRPGLPRGYKFGTTAGWGMVDWENTTTVGEKLVHRDLVFPSNPQCDRRTDTSESRLEFARASRRRRQEQSRNSMGQSEASDICVKIPKQGSPKCVGGLGSPLQIVLETPYCMASILGVNTAGRGGCATTSNQAHFTRISDHIAWIETTVWG